MTLLNKITVDQFQRIVSIEANSIYTASDKKIGVIAVLDGIPIEQVEGRLVEIDVSRFRRQQKQEVGQAKTREELERIAAQRGYKPAWVEHILKARQRKAG